MATTIKKIEAFYLRAPVAVRVVSALGGMNARQTLLVRVEDSEGAHGWGEIWCNFPAWGGAHRARLVQEVVGPWYLGRDCSRPDLVFEEAQRHIRLMMIQCGEFGPFQNVVAGIDCALWDLTARRKGVPLAEMLGGGTRSLPAYASGINPDGALETMRAQREVGYRKFKLKLGFPDDDANLAALLGDLADGEELLVDVNQGFAPAEARRRLPEIAAMGVGWIEEPVPADESLATWRELAMLSAVPLAGGENVTSLDGFSRVIEENVFGVVQPDIAKWGGLSRGRRIALRAMAAGRRYCPHYLGGGVGLLHSAHLLSAVGGDGYLEIDCNPNPLREALVPLPKLDDKGCFNLSKEAGIGVEPDSAVMAEYGELTLEAS